MKNRFVERMKRLAKQRHRTSAWHLSEHGFRSDHFYGTSQSDQLSWWDDVSFILNDYRVLLIWEHPRMSFEDAIKEETNRLTADLQFSSFMKDGKKNYKKIGKSRKKLVSTSFDPTSEGSKWERRREVHLEVEQSITVEITPSLRSEWSQSNRIVYLCAPVEVRNESDLAELVAMTRRLLLREVTLQDLFPDYHYGRVDWQREELMGSGTVLRSHAIAL